MATYQGFDCLRSRACLAKGSGKCAMQQQAQSASHNLKQKASAAMGLTANAQSSNRLKGNIIWQLTVWGPKLLWQRVSTGWHCWNFLRPCWLPNPCTSSHTLSRPGCFDSNLWFCQQAVDSWQMFDWQMFHMVVGHLFMHFSSSSSTMLHPVNPANNLDWQSRLLGRLAAEQSFGFQTHMSLKQDV